MWEGTGLVAGQDWNPLSEISEDSFGESQKDPNLSEDSPEDPVLFTGTMKVLWF
jgi:hypothetical protein